MLAEWYFGPLVFAHEVIVTVGDRDDFSDTCACHFKHRSGTAICLEQQAFAVGEFHERFRVSLARDWPQARSSTTGKNDGNYHLIRKGKSVFHRMPKISNNSHKPEKR